LRSPVARSVRSRTSVALHSEDVIGQVIGSYRIVSELGKGGMGVVYRAEHVQLGRPAALKMLLSQLSSDAAIVQRFFNEARAASAIDHPGIVEIYDFGRHSDGRAYIVMALLKGESVEQRLARGPLAPHDGATIVAQAVAALEAAHARGIVHRDLKPDNIFLVPNDLMPAGIQVKLLDFGIAKLADERTAGFKTQTGALIGTPAFMSPEQCMGSADLDHRTDIYSIGCILFHVFCGRPPFTSSQGTGMMIAAHLRDAAPDPRAFNPHVPEALARIVLRCLEKEPAARFQTATELRNALVAAGANATPSRHPVGQGQGQGQSPSPSPRMMSDASYAGTLAAPAQPSGYAATTPATTRSGAAAQLVAPAPARRSLAVFVVGGLLVALAGVVAVVAVRGGKDGDPISSPVAAGSAPPAVPAAPSPPPAAPAVAAAPSPSPTAAVPAAPPPPPAAPAIPAVPAPATGRPAVTTTPRPAATAGAPSFRLDAKQYEPGDTIEIRFTAPVSSKPQNRAWVTVIDAGRPASAYGVWAYVDDGATASTLKAPTRPGAYEVRLHTDYPAKTFHVVHTVPVTVGSLLAESDAEAPAEPTVTPLSAQRFTVASPTVRPGGKIDVRFATALRAAPRERFWITIVAAGAGDATWGAYDYVPADARRMQLAAPAKPGDYEVRLHANYPTRSTNLVHRVAIRVDD
jgi:eukaryotic-like serine/threonine-protein kinase